MSNEPYQRDPRMPGYQQAPDPASYSANDTTERIDSAGNRVESHAEVYEDENLRRSNLRYWITSVVYFVLGVLEVILLLRFIFRLLGANEGSSFVMFLYNLSGIFVGPFNGIFNDQGLGHSVFETSTLVAMLVYALIAWGIVSLFRVIFAPVYSGQQRVTTTRRSRF